MKFAIPSKIIQPSPSFDSGLRLVAYLLTSTCGIRYGSYPLRGKYCHEMALRIVLASIEVLSCPWKICIYFHRKHPCCDHNFGKK